jgi:hypothetical protein
MRVIVTGSRKWPDASAVYNALSLLYRDHGPFTLVHGACSTGADAQARHWFQVTGQTLGCAEDAWPADWTKFGKRAGPIRNTHMVEAGADQVLAFPMPEGSGTQHTIDLAEKAGIPVRKWKWNG